MKKFFTLGDKIKIADEAFSVPDNVLPTALKYGVGRSQIRRWNAIKGKVYSEDTTGTPIHSEEDFFTGSGPPY